MSKLVSLNSKDLEIICDFILLKHNHLFQSANVLFVHILAQSLSQVPIELHILPDDRMWFQRSSYLHLLLPRCIYNKVKEQFLTSVSKNKSAYLSQVQRKFQPNKSSPWRSSRSCSQLIYAHVISSPSLISFPSI